MSWFGSRDCGRRAGLALAVLLWGVASGFSAEGKVRVLTSFLPVYCLTANVAGGAADVENLLPGSVSPHDYQLSPADLRKIERADLIVVNGLGVENFLERALQNAGTTSSGGKVITLSEGLSGQLLPYMGGPRAGEADRYNPHIWLDPLLATHCVTNILRALQRADAKNAAVYGRNAAAFVEELKNLDKEMARIVAPIKSEPVVTYHNAFAYFARRYGLKIAGVVEPIPEVPPSPRATARLLRTIREQHVKAVFAEPAESPRLARQIANDAGVKLGELDPIETGPVQPGTYEKVMRRNAETLLQMLR